MREVYVRIYEMRRLETLLSNTLLYADSYMWDLYPIEQYDVCTLYILG